MKKVSAIITSDIHTMDTQPLCRTEDFMQVQARKLKWLSELQKKHNCPILDGGDIFQHWKPSPSLIRWAYENLPNGIVTVPGNHDLEAHSLELYTSSGLSVLEAVGKVRVLKQGQQLTVELGCGRIADLCGFPWGTDPFARPFKVNVDHFKVAICHYMTYMGGLPFPGCSDPDAMKFISKMIEFDLIVTGHNHKTFSLDNKQTPDGNILINPGSLTRHKADQVDHRPSVFLWYAESFTFEQVFIPIRSNAVIRDHLDIEEQKEERTAAFVKRLKEGVNISISFEDNMEAHLAANRVRKGTKDLIWKCIKG